MVSIISTELSLAAATSNLEVPTELQCADDFRSLQNQAAANKLNRDESAYSGIDWKVLQGFVIPFDDARINSGIWLQGYRLYQSSSQRY